jgi:hypothetical protein
MSRRLTCFLLSLPLLGCVEQTMSIRSDPPGALVYLNDQEVGRTPLTRDFVWYGNYDVEVRKEGYQTLKTHQWVKAPASLWVPFDLFAELLPFHFKDHHDLGFKLNAESQEAVDPKALVARADEMKGQLESSKLPKSATTSKTPTTRPTK